MPRSACYLPTDSPGGGLGQQFPRTILSDLIRRFLSQPVCSDFELNSFPLEPGPFDEESM